MPETPPGDVSAAVALVRNDLQHLTEAVVRMEKGLGQVDQKSDDLLAIIREQYLTRMDFTTWRDEDYIPFKRDVAAKQEQADTRARWLSGLVWGVLGSGLVTAVIVWASSLHGPHG